MGKVKLVWVFSGTDAETKAKEKAKIITQKAKGISFVLYVGAEYISHISWLAYLVVSDEKQGKLLFGTPTRVEAFEL